MLTLAQVEEVAHGAPPPALTADDRERIRAGRALVDRLVAEHAPVYGVTTGFGELSKVRIDPAYVRTLQRNLIRSHAVGAGDPLAPEVVRGMLLLLQNSLRKGYSGARVELVERCLQLLARDVARPGSGQLAGKAEKHRAPRQCDRMAGIAHDIATGIDDERLGVFQSLDIVEQERPLLVAVINVPDPCDHGAAVADFGGQITAHPVRGRTFARHDRKAAQLRLAVQHVDHSLEHLRRRAVDRFKGDGRAVIAGHRKRGTRAAAGAAAEAASRRQQQCSGNRARDAPSGRRGPK